MKNISEAMGAQALSWSAGEVEACCRTTGPRPTTGPPCEPPIPALLLQRLPDHMQLLQSEIEKFTLRHHERTEAEGP